MSNAVRREGSVYALSGENCSKELHASTIAAWNSCTRTDEAWTEQGGTGFAIVSERGRGLLSCDERGKVPTGSGVAELSEKLKIKEL